jgi:Prokaryotic Cytochrome C oxidase subunit IV
MIAINKHLGLAWLWLVVLTLLSFGSAEGQIDRRIVMAAIFAIAAIKGQLVASHFMEVGHALPHWRALYRVWIFGIAAVLAAGHIL